MNPESLLILLAICALIYFLRQQKLQRETALRDDLAPRPVLERDPRTGELEREVIELRKRIEVLERIATDRHDSRRLSDEIDALRGE